MRLGILGGTFDPPHLGHLILAQYALEQLSLDSVLFIPAGDPWRKSHRAVTPAAHRLEMTRLAISDNDSFVLDDLEVKREGPTYTEETLRVLRSRSETPDDLFFLAGEDALADMPNWREPQNIAQLATIVIAPREGSVPPVDLPFDVNGLTRIVMPYIGLSSTGLRERAAQGLSLRYQVPDIVEAYIRRHGLFGPR